MLFFVSTLHFVALKVLDMGRKVCGDSRALQKKGLLSAFK